MSDKLTKKDLQAKIESLEKELSVWKSKTQLARNYSIVKEENDELQQKLHKKKEWWMKWAESEKEEVEEEDDEDSE